MEVGIEDCLHIEFEYNKSKYHLKDAVLGKIFFLLVRHAPVSLSSNMCAVNIVCLPRHVSAQVRIKIKHMEIAIIKRESTGTGANTYNENETVAKFEIMDGAPVRGVFALALPSAVGVCDEMRGTMWHHVAPCGTVWHHVAPCGNMWQL